MEGSKAEDKGKIEKRQAAADREKKNRNRNYEGDNGGEEDDAVAPSSSNRGRGSGSGSDSNKIDSKKSRSIVKYRRGKRSRNSENGSKQKSGGRTLQV